MTGGDHGAALAQRLDALEERIAALEAQQPHPAHTVTPTSSAEVGAASGTEAGAGAPAHSPDPAPAADPMWAVTSLRQQTGAVGGILFAGTLPDTPAGPVSWQYARPTDHFDTLDFTDAASALDALGHPARLGLLQEIHRGAASVAELSELDVFGSTGQIYHHLQQLAHAGWLESPQRGQWRIPAHRLTALLTIILATLG